MRSKRTTLKDISNRMGLSIPTISRALGGYEDISLKTREEVAEVANEMRYSPNPYAKSLVSGKSIIGNILIVGVPIVLKSITSNPYYAEILKAFLDKIDFSKHQFVLSAGENSGGTFKNYHNLIFNHDITAAVILDLKENDERVEEFTAAKIPLVVLGEYEPQSDFQCSVWTDNISGAYIATNHLLKKGCKRVAMISGLKGQLGSTSRINGYRKALEDENIPFDKNIIIEPVEIGEHSGYTAMMELFQRNIDFDSVFCASDLRSVGAIKAINEKGLEIPKDISVVGYDDLPLASYITPTLTTISQPTYEVGIFAMKQLDRLITGKKISNQKKSFQPQLIVRNSS